MTTNRLPELWLYQSLARIPLVNYRGKIMLIAFIGTHIPLLVLAGYFVISATPDSSYAIWTLAVCLIATLAGTGLTLFVLHHLLRPISVTANGLRQYIGYGQMPYLPTIYKDDVGVLMADAAFAVNKLDATINQLTHYDSITRLPNRKQFLQQVSLHIAALKDVDKRTAQSGICVIGIKNLDKLTAAFGSIISDTALRRVAQLLENCLDQQHLRARIGENSFAILFQGIKNPDEIAEAAAEIVALLKHGVKQDDIELAVELVLSASAGISLYPLDGDNADSLLNNAITAQSIANDERGLSNITFFSPHSRETLRQHHTLERDLRHALARNELSLDYQPVIDYKNRKISGAEALIRWHHPEQGLILPSVFIPIAEESGLIDEIGLWTLRTACRQIKSWRDQGFGQLKVAVNISARQFSNPELPNYIGKTLQTLNLGPNCLEVELTETAAMTNTDNAHRMLSKLRDMGVTVAIDDFGTGYSSLSYLRTLPFDRLKIDREFVQNVASNPDREAICKALIGLAHSLDLEILAEGTETYNEVKTLFERGCHTFQGYYFSRPLNVDRFTDLLADPNWLERLFCKQTETPPDSKNGYKLQQPPLFQINLPVAAAP